jgi:hypothetical protein
MRPIGGYFGLELGMGTEYHSNALRLNSGRNCLSYIMKSKGYKKIYLPYFSCEVLLEPVKKLGLDYEYYFINENFEPIFNFNSIAEEECFFYINYWGLKDEYIDSLKGVCKNLIIDNVQSFFSKTIGVDNFNSARKFFGVPDGGYCYIDKLSDDYFETDLSYNKCSHLLLRAEGLTEKGYGYFLENEEMFSGEPVKYMSHLTKSILSSVDYDSVAAKRKSNFHYLQQALQNSNELNFFSNSGSAPMSYPFYTTNATLRQRLIENKVFTPVYWKSVLNLVTSESLEYKYVQNIIHIPVDQRCEKEDLDKICKIISNEY